MSRAAQILAFAVLVITGALIVALVLRAQQPKPAPAKQPSAPKPPAPSPTGVFFPGGEDPQISVPPDDPGPVGGSPPAPARPPIYGPEAKQCADGRWVATSDPCPEDFSYITP